MNGVDAYHNGYTHNGHHPLETPDSFTASPADPNEYPPGPVDSSLHVKRQRSMKFSLYPARPRTSSREPTRADTVSPITPMTSQRQASIHRHPTNSPQTEPQHNTQRPVTSHDRPSNDSYRTLPQTSLTNATYNTSTKSIPNAPHSVQKRPSEASRLRALNNGHHSSRSPDGRRTPDRSRTPENFSRPRAPSIKRGNEPPKPLLQNANTFPLPAYDEEQTPTQWSANVRDRGLSTSSSQSNINNYPTRPLRASSSIPDYHAPDSLYSRQRNLSNTNYSRPARGHPPPDNSAIANRHDPIPRSNGLESDEVRASFRSALTTNSSYVGTSGTERSSVMTRSSSATSVYGKDEGMSVDDAIGMYSGGFVDSEVEDHHGTTRPPTANSERVTTSRDEGAMGTVSPEPQSRPIIRDSSAIFQLQTHVATGETHSSPPEDLHLQPQGGGLKPTRLQEAYTPVNEEVKADIDRDRYGFRKKTQYITSEQYDAWNGPYTEYLARRRKKWVALLKDSDLPTQNPMRFPAKSAKIKRFVRKGIPPEWRGEAWFYYAGGSAMVAKHYGVYEDLVSKAAAGAVAETDNEIIERDLNRTFPDNVKFKPDVPEGDGNAGDGHPPFEHPETPVLQSLRRVLQAFSIYNPKIGYCQSLNFLAGLLLLFMDEEKSFWMLNIITRVYLPGTHEVNLEGANVDLGVLMTSIKETMPAIWGKIGGELDGTAGDDKVSMRLPPITLCCTAWFMSCFIGTLPIETTLRVWDSFFLEGSKTLFRIALAIFKVGEQEIRAVSDPMEIFQVVQTIPRRLIDVNALVDVCFFRRRNGFGHLSQATIETRRAERRAGYAEERAIANGDVVLARKGTLFSRKRLK